MGNQQHVKAVATNSSKNTTSNKVIYNVNIIQLPARLKQPQMTSPTVDRKELKEAYLTKSSKEMEHSVTLYGGSN